MAHGLSPSPRPRPDALRYQESIKVRDWAAALGLDAGAAAGLHRDRQATDSVRGASAECARPSIHTQLAQRRYPRNLRGASLSQAALSWLTEKGFLSSEKPYAAAAFLRRFQPKMPRPPSADANSGSAAGIGVVAVASGGLNANAMSYVL